MLEEHNKIDTIAIAKDGFVELVIMDAGITEDSEKRFSHLIEKLKAYVYYVIEGDFKKDYPEKSQREVRFLVMCRIPPTEKMEKLTRLSNPECPEEGFNILYRNFPDSDDAVETSSAIATSIEPPKNKMGLYVSLSLASLTLVASLIGWINVGRSPLPGIIIAVFFAGFGFLFTKEKRRS